MAAPSSTPRPSGSLHLLILGPTRKSLGGGAKKFLEEPDPSVLSRQTDPNQLSLFGVGIGGGHAGADNGVLELESLARKHWREFLPEKVKELEAEGKLNEAVRGAALLAQDEIEHLMQYQHYSIWDYVSF
jgi:hypothetical protein